MSDRGAASGTAGGLRFHAATELKDAGLDAWTTFATTLPLASYQQDPRWAAVERRGQGSSARTPWFFWAETDEGLVLTALGVRRRLPIPGRVFWEFNRGPLCRDDTVLEAWLGWFLARAAAEAARVRVQPAMLLQPEGDRVETLLERLGFVRHRLLGGWTTVSVDLTSGDEAAVFAGLRSATRRAIRKSQRIGIEVRREDDAAGRAALADLQGDLATRQPVEHTDLESLTRISEHWLDGGRGGTILVARREGELLAAGLVIVHRDRAYLPFIPSSHTHRDLPSSHLLVWEAIRWAHARGCRCLDLVGYSMTARPGDALWGINQFKRGFAPLDRLEEYVAIHELVRSPAVVAAATATRRLQEALRRRGERP